MLAKAKRWLFRVANTISPVPLSETERLRRLKRYESTTTTLLGPRIEVPDPISFLYTYHDIFERNLYRFNGVHSPRILDVGANIGLASIYFKRLYSGSHITAFEPDPQLCSVLRRNLTSCGMSDVEVIQAAAWSRECSLEFASEGSDAGRLVDDGAGQHTSVITVPTVRLRDFLEERVDFLKIDIEGAEAEVMDDIAPHLRNVQHVFLEYHADKNSPQRLHDALRILAEAGFRIHMETTTLVEAPFVKDITYGDFDLLVNIFARRRN